MLDELLKFMKKTSSPWNGSILAERLGLLETHPNQDSNQSKWSLLSCSGDPPPVRSGHSALVVGETMYIFGGYNEGKCHDDLYAFNLVRHEWRLIQPSNGVIPDGRASHSWCVSSDQRSLYLFGGSGPHWGQTNMGKLLQFSLEDENWHIVEAIGHQPPPGYGQTMCAVGDRLFLFGGTSGHVYVNDLYIFDIPTSTWKLHHASGAIPSPRYKHQVVTMNTQMFVFGGGLYDPPPGDIDIHCLDTNTLEWRKIQANGNGIPPSRIAHSCVPFSHDDHRVMMFGGRDHEGKRLRDLCEFNMLTLEWKILDQESNIPDARDFHSAVMFEGQMFIFGGSNGYERNNDVHRYRTTLTPSTLMLLSMQCIRRNYLQLDPRQLQLLPPELLQGIHQLNPHVCHSRNDIFY